MGVTIHYSLKYEDKNALWKALDKTEAFAREIFKQEGLTIEFNEDKDYNKEGWIVRENPFHLIILFPGCEDLSFHFRHKKTWTKEEDWSLEKAKIKDQGNRIDDDDWFAGGFCKTQYQTKDVYHIYISELLRCMVQTASLVEVYDEAHYYETRDISVITESINENQEIIDRCFNDLLEGFDKDNITKGKDLK